MKKNELFLAIKYALGMYWLQIRITFTKPYCSFHGFMGYRCEVYPQLKAVVYTEYDQGLVRKVAKLPDGEFYMEDENGWEVLTGNINQVFKDYEREMITKQFEEIILK